MMTPLGTNKFNQELSNKVCNKGKLDCIFCLKFFDKHYIDDHVIRHIGERGFFCGHNKCEKSFPTKKSLAIHQETHSEIRKFSCKHCSKCFKSRDVLWTHMNLHSKNPKHYRCTFCPKAFAQAGGLQGHIRACHTLERDVKCEVCGKLFYRKEHLTSHMRTHTGEKPFKCGHCSYRSSHKSAVRQHEMRIHSTKEDFKNAKLYPCEFCDKVFKFIGNFKGHLRTHTKEKPYKCQTCGKELVTATALKSHQFVHTGEKPYKCEYCGKTFTQRSNRNSHVRVRHHEDRKFKCHLCRHKFVLRENLEFHLERHRNGSLRKTRVECIFCGEMRANGSLRNHIRTHTGENPWQCEVCGKTFATSIAHRVHWRIHTNEKPYECNMCGLRCNQKGNLDRHVCKSKKFSC